MVWIYKRAGSRILTARPGRMQGAERPEEMGGDGGGGDFQAEGLPKKKIDRQPEAAIGTWKGSKPGSGTNMCPNLGSWADLVKSFCLIPSSVI